MPAIKIQDVMRKLRERQQVLTEAETAALFEHLDSLVERIGGLEAMLAEARQRSGEEAPGPVSGRAKGKEGTQRRAKGPEKKALLEEYGLLYEALRHARPTTYTEGETHFIRLSQMAALAADAVALFEMGVAIDCPLRLDEDDEEDESDDEAEEGAAGAWGEIISDSLLSNQTIVVLSVNDRFEQEQAKAAFGAVLKRMQNGTLDAPLPESVIEMEGVLPWSEKPARAFFHHLLESMGIQTIQEALKEGVHEHPNMGIFWKVAGSDFLGNVLARISSPSIYDPYDRQETKFNTIELVLAYLGDGCSPSELRRLELPRNLTVEDRFQLLATICQFRVGTKFSTDHQDHARFWLWIDQLENLLQYPPKEQKDVINGLMTFIKGMPHFLTLCLNIADAAQQEKVLQALGERFLDYVEIDFTRPATNTE